MDCEIVSYHLESYNFMTDSGVMSAALDIPPVKMEIDGDNYQFSYSSAQIGRPNLSTPKMSDTMEAGNLFPAECRQRAITYRAPLRVLIDLNVNGQRLGVVECIAGEVPVMLCSKVCNLFGLSAEQLVKRGEDDVEKGGYFICKGSEKVVRLLVANKRNFPLVMRDDSARNKGRLYSPYFAMMRCIRGNYSSSIIRLHYLENASIVMQVQYDREMFYLPLMCVLKCLTGMSDRAIFEHMSRGRPGDSFWAGCITNMLSTAQNEGVRTTQDALTYLGTRFRVVMENRYGKNESNAAITRHLLRASVCIHLNSDEQKFHCLVMMAQKLIALVKNEILPETTDNPQFQEASVSGHIILLIIRDRLERMLLNTRRRLEIKHAKSSSFNLTTESFAKVYGTTKGEITNGLEYFLATGNLVNNTGIGLMQSTGFAVPAERINRLRFVSHFRAIHRGAFFTTMRTSDVRKLRPEAWGFICPVHTPDGAPCGLLNHVTASCRIVTHYSKTEPLRALLSTIGIVPHHSTKLMLDDQPTYPVMLDGDFFGYVPRSKAAIVARYLRQLKVDVKDKRVPTSTEITLIRASADPANVATQFPGLYLYTSPGRLIRPVRNLPSQCIEYIGIFEQVYLSIAVDLDEAELNVTMHQEIHPSALFSFAGNLIPFPDHNQSPRNVYQCQMGKQTMGVPVHAWRTRADGKMYLLQTPQDPLIKLAAYDRYEMTNFPLGTHACVAVISYTGYDMEDAMVINKGSYERGLAHGCVIKVERINLVQKRGFSTSCDKVFYANPMDLPKTIGEDGLPIPGRVYHQGEIYYSVYDRASGSYETPKFKYAESMWCASVRIVYDDDSRDAKTHALIQWRIPRNPIIGDKFASRHGQKGINSFLWPVESLPFSESGMVPDIVFNPHGFPSRMTIGMMIESMAGKAACMHGEYYDASPFVYSEKKTAIKHFGDLLTKAGYNYMGNETMYSGVDGSLMEVQIFFGVVYYQRLRHMISDKFQVRSTGSVDPITLQPIKGRKLGGGIRFGEMERDALIAHGTAFCLQDRLFNCSDKDESWICAKCGSITSVTTLQKRKEEHQLNGDLELEQAYDSYINGHNNKLNGENDKRLGSRNTRHCMVCNRTEDIYLVQVPRIFRYLCAELSAMNVRMCMEVAHPKDVYRN